MSRDSILKQYVQGLAAVAAHGDATEQSFYACLSDLLEQVARATGRSNVRVVTLPKKTEAGNPDFRLWNGTDRIAGYMEAKQPGLHDLGTVESSEQLRRYRDTFPNLLLTNFTEFRRYRSGLLVDTVRLVSPAALRAPGAAIEPEAAKGLWKLLDGFLAFSVPKATSAAELAIELAKRTRFLRDVVAQELAEEETGRAGELRGFYEAFQQFLIAGLTPEEFADLYAQTITYGLFAARTRAGEGFSRRNAFDHIPRSIGVLRSLFRFVSLDNLPEQLAWVVDDIAEVLAVADAPGILDAYFHERRGSDPVVHFYETFLAHYDPLERERRGVYYTPEPVVSYIVRSLHALLKSDFALTDGLAAPGVAILDPAAGTMTFLARAALEAVREFEGKYGTGAREQFIRERILPNYYAFELMMAPYAVGHLKMGFFLEELGHRLADDERLRSYLTNTLEMDELGQSHLPGFSALAEESRLAGEVKKGTTVLVILGNPPYSGHSTNQGPWIRALIEDYKQVDGHPLGEKNPKWLQDDYVKFIRFAQWKMEGAGQGVIGIITNHGYLDNPTFRGMRQSLLRSFEEVYLLDLHGNALKREVCPDGSPDQNVFDIRQGVAIALFVNRPGRTGQPATVHHADLWGTREDKYEWLEAHDITGTEWQELAPASPSYLFVPRDEALAAEYERFVPVPAIFPVNSVGIVTARDALTIHWTPDDVWRTVTSFAGMDAEQARLAFDLGPDARDWKVALAQRDLRDSGPSRDKVLPILYRPFDVRHTYYTGRSRGFICMPRPDVMRHMLQENLALMTCRQLSSHGWSHTMVSACLADDCMVSNRTRERGYLCPLYLYPDAGRRDLFSAQETAERTPNLDAKLVEALAAAHNRAPSPEEILAYVYAALYTPAYRQRYAEFLRRDFPRVPFTADPALFARMAEAGRRLVELHLLRSPELDLPTAHFEGAGDGGVGRGREKGVHYDAVRQRVHISAGQYFAPVPPAAWEYRVGGYQVCEKWLKDRQDRRLRLEEIRTYCRIVTSLVRTMEVQAELDGIYAGVEETALSLD